MRYSELLERLDKNTNLGTIISLAIKAKANLDIAASGAIDDWQASCWDSGALEMAFRANNDIAKAVDMAFSPVRQAMKSLYGNSITLYRGQRKFEQHELTSNRVLFSWTADPKVASDFAIGGQLYPEITDHDIDAAISQYNRIGFFQIGNRKYKRSLENPGYYEIYRGKEHLGNDEDVYLKDDLKQLQTDRNDANNELQSKGEVIEHQVPIDAIVWVTNDLNSKEFIVKCNPLNIKNS